MISILWKADVHRAGNVKEDSKNPFHDFSLLYVQARVILHNRSNVQVSASNKAKVKYYS